MSYVYTFQQQPTPNLQHYFSSACCIDNQSQLSADPQLQASAGPAALSHSQSNLEQSYQLGGASCPHQPSEDRHRGQLQYQQHTLNAERLDLTDEDLRVLASILDVDDDDSCPHTRSR